LKIKLFKKPESTLAFLVSTVVIPSNEKLFC